MEIGLGEAADDDENDDDDVDGRHDVVDPR